MYPPSPTGQVILDERKSWLAFWDARSRSMHARHAPAIGSSRLKTLLLVTVSRHYQEAPVTAPLGNSMQLLLEELTGVLDYQRNAEARGGSTNSSLVQCACVQKVVYL